MPETGTDYVYRYDRGTLIIDLINPRSNQRLFRGTAQAEVDLSQAPDDRDNRKLKQAIENIFSHLPKSH
jgi:hypothetical protein